MFAWDGSEYKTVCMDCYKLLVRKCVQCKVSNLPIGAPKWQTTCLDCYLEKKRARYDTCPTCPPAYAKYLRRPVNEPCCKECKLRLTPVNE